MALPPKGRVLLPVLAVLWLLAKVGRPANTDAGFRSTEPERPTAFGAIMTTWVAICLLALVLLWGILSFNRLVRLRLQVRAAWAQIDVQLRRRYDLIPAVVDSVKGYMAHERTTLEAVTEARRKAEAAGNDIEARAIAEGRLSGALSKLMAMVEAYPQLKASANVLALQEELVSTENRIAFARQHFNDCVMSFNTAIASLPDLLIAGPLGFRAETMYRAGEPARQPVAVEL
jgi:LemA protein